MSASDVSAEPDAVEEQNKLLHEENTRLKAKVVELELELAKLRGVSSATIDGDADPATRSETLEPTEAVPKLACIPGEQQLSAADVLRYSRQMLVPSFGAHGQRRLGSATVLVVGAGGLGSPLISYLAAAGVGQLCIVDDDTVAVSNLHRQVIHAGALPGTPKVLSAAAAVRRINPQVQVTAISQRLTAELATQLMPSIDVVADCSDNLATRYLLSDAAVLCGKPLVSGASVGLEGYATIYNHRTASGKQGPCYRCVYPNPPPSASVGSCAENGVIGAVPGVIGCLQALEVLKLTAGLQGGATLAGRLAIFDAKAGEFRCIKLRPRRQTCEVCGSNPAITSLDDTLSWCARHGLSAYEGCVRPSLPVLPRSARLSCAEFAAVAGAGSPYLLLDVRPTVQFEISRLEPAVNIPLEILKTMDPSEIVKLAAGRPIYVLCRRGVDSTTATSLLRALLDVGEVAASPDQTPMLTLPSRICNIDGGLAAWRETVDRNFPYF